MCRLHQLEGCGRSNTNVGSWNLLLHEFSESCFAYNNVHVQKQATFKERTLRTDLLTRGDSSSKRANCNANTRVVGTPTGHDGEKAQAKHIDAEIDEVELIVVEVKLCQLSELPDLCRDGTCQRIFIIHTQNGRLVYQLQSREFLSTRTSQLILVKVKVCQLRELPDLCRDGTCQRIFSHTIRMVDSRFHYTHSDW